MTPYQWLWLSAFVKTQLIEVSLGLLLLYRLNVQGRLPISFECMRDFTVLFFASLLTHPPLWFVLPRLCKHWGVSYEGYVMLGESLVVLCEALWYRALLRPLQGRLGLAFLLSCALNVVSAVVGMLL